MSISNNPVKLKNKWGMIPVKKLFAKYKNWILLKNDNTDSGLPDISFMDTLRKFNFEIFENVAGSVPVNILESKNASCRENNWPIVSGSGPESKLKFRAKIAKSLNEHIDLGINPVSLLLDIYNITNFVKFPIDGSNGPDSKL